MKVVGWTAIPCRQIRFPSLHTNTRNTDRDECIGAWLWANGHTEEELCWSIRDLRVKQRTGFVNIQNAIVFVREQRCQPSFLLIFFFIFKTFHLFRRMGWIYWGFFTENSKTFHWNIDVDRNPFSIRFISYNPQWLLAVITWCIRKLIFFRIDKGRRVFDRWRFSHSVPQPVWKISSSDCGQNSYRLIILFFENTQNKNKYH